MEDSIMTLAKLSSSMFPSFPSFFDGFFDGELRDWNRRNYSSSNSTLPAVNVKENENEFRIEVAAPGMQKSDFIVNYDNGSLSISSEHKQESEEKDEERVTRREYSYQSFQRSFMVPETVVQAENISAKYEDGILYLTLPKREEVKPKPAKQIEIS